MRKDFLLQLVSMIFLACFYSATAHASINFLSLSDIHFDPFYSCKQAVPCPVILQLVKAPVSQWERILTVNDTGSPRYREDSNNVLFQSTLAASKEAAEVNHVKFVILLGDYISHDFRGYYRKYSADKSRQGYALFVKKTIAFVTQQIAKTFPNLEVYAAVGNNDSYQNDYVSDPKGSFFYDTGLAWANLIKNKKNHAEILKNFHLGGYYAVNLQPDLRLIILNTNFFSSKAKGRGVRVAAEQELLWLHQELISAKNNHQKVFMAMHIPMGVDVYATLKIKLFTLLQLWHSLYTERFQAELKQFYPEIMGIFMGHLHSDWFQILTVDQNGAIPATGTPSISPLFGNNPGFKIYTYSEKTKQLENFVTYYKPLGSTRQWGIEYDFNRVYQPHCDVCSLIQGMDSLTEKGELAEHFKLFYAVATHTQPITTKWYPYYWCAIHEVNVERYRQCVGCKAIG